MNFLACQYKSKHFAQRQLNFAPSHDSDKVTFRNSAAPLLFLIFFSLAHEPLQLKFGHLFLPLEGAEYMDTLVAGTGTSTARPRLTHTG